MSDHESRMFIRKRGRTVNTKHTLSNSSRPETRLPLSIQGCLSHHRAPSVSECTSNRTENSPTRDLVDTYSGTKSARAADTNATIACQQPSTTEVFSSPKLSDSHPLFSHSIVFTTCDSAHVNDEWQLPREPANAHASSLPRSERQHPHGKKFGITVNSVGSAAKWSQHSRGATHMVRRDKKKLQSNARMSRKPNKLPLTALLIFRDAFIVDRWTNWPLPSHASRGLAGVFLICFSVMPNLLAQ